MRIAILLCCLLLTSCGEKESKKTNAIILPPRFIQSNRNQSYNDRYAFLKYDIRKHSYIFKTGIAAHISKQEVITIEKLIATYIKKYNQSSQHYIKNTLDYSKQLIAINNNRGEKEVWVNCLCVRIDDKYWNQEVSITHDGGNCYFSLIVNLTTGKCYKLIVNGLA